MTGWLDDPSVVRWRIHLGASPERVYAALSTASGRESFWADRAPDDGSWIRFAFSNGVEVEAPIVEAQPPRRFSIRYFEDSLVTFDIETDGKLGTDLTVTERDFAASDREIVLAGWVVVLLAMKAAVDFGVDIRNHDDERSWEAGYVDV